MSRKSNWLTHEATIVAGESSVFIGWVNATKEAMTFASVAEYATISAKSSTFTARNTIAQNCGTIKTGIKKYKTLEALLVAYDVVYSYRSVSTMGVFLRGSGQTKAVRGKRFNAKNTAKQFEKRGLTRAQVLEAARYMTK